jgi:hypothetical protein
VDLNREIYAFLDKISLESLMQRRDVRDVSRRQDELVASETSNIQVS